MKEQVNLLLCDFGEVKKMTKTEDKILALICVVILIGSIGFFSFIKSGEEDEKDEPVEETPSTDAMLGATNAFVTSGKSTMITAEAHSF